MESNSKKQKLVRVNGTKKEAVVEKKVKAVKTKIKKAKVERKKL